MLVPVITRKNVDDVLKSAALCELRLDYWSHLDCRDIAECMQRLAKPCILTLRPQRAGGRFQGSEAERFAILQQLLLLNPAYLDIEDFVSADVITQLHATNPQVKLIRSFHDFAATPTDLSSVLQAMQHPAISLYKIATFANSTLDALRMLQWLQQQKNVIGLCMGEYGSCTRILAPVISHGWTYVPHGDEIVAPGMLSAAELQQIYRYEELNRQTRIFGLIGDPVMQSEGHRFHNAHYRQHNINAVYVKFRITQSELAEFFQLITHLPIEGLSVTMPLKESVLPFVHHFDETAAAVGAVNTLTLREGKISAMNTDVNGVLQPILRHCIPAQKKALIIGAGGAAKAVAYALTQAGAHITVINRTPAKAQHLAQQFAGHHTTAATNYFDIVINTLPDTPATKDFISEAINQSVTATTIAMDIVYKPKETHFIQSVKKHTQKIIYGEEMFTAQATDQAKIFSLL